jgi:hypothetical protein
MPLPMPTQGPPTMPPIAQSPMPTMIGSMQPATIPPGGAPLNARVPGQIPQGMRRVTPAVNALFQRR